MIPTLAEQIEAYRKNHVVKTIGNLVVYGKEKAQGIEREKRRTAIYNKMGNGEVWTVKQLQSELGWDVRQISSAIKVLIDNGFVKIVDRARINNCKMCLYQRTK